MTTQIEDLNYENFIDWFNSAPHRAKYKKESPAFLAAWEAWNHLMTVNVEEITLERKQIADLMEQFNEDVNEKSELQFDRNDTINLWKPLDIPIGLPSDCVDMINRINRMIPFRIDMGHLKEDLVLQIDLPRHLTEATFMDLFKRGILKPYKK